MSDVLRKLIWSRIGEARQFEDFELIQPGDNEWAFRGAVHVLLDGELALVHYSINCDSTWTFIYASIGITYGKASPEPTTAAIARTSSGAWLVEQLDAPGRRNEVERPDLADCIDIDLSVTPSTNTLPIRRLNLAVGESAEVTAAWVRFPALDVQPLRQRYTRLAPDRYLYESLESDFTAELTVDDLGLVTHYPGGWERWTPDKQ